VWTVDVTGNLNLHQRQMHGSADVARIVLQLNHIFIINTI